MRREHGPGPGGDELEQLLAGRGNWLMGIAIAKALVTIRRGFRHV